MVGAECREGRGLGVYKLSNLRAPSGYEIAPLDWTALTAQWGKNGKNRAPFYAPLCPFDVSPAGTKKRQNPLYIGLGRFFSSILQHNRGMKLILYFNYRFIFAFFKFMMNHLI